MPVTEAQCADALSRLGLLATDGEWRADRHAAAVSLRPHDRGRPDRGSGAHHRLQPAADHAAAGTDHRASCRRNHGAAASPCASAARRPGLPGNHQLQLRRGAAGSATWPATPTRSSLLNPIASQMSVMRSSLLGSLLQVLKFNLDRKAERVRVFELGRVFLRDAAVTTTDSHRARHPPAHAGGGPGLRRRRWIAMGAQGQRGGFLSTSRATSRPCCRPCRRSSSRLSIRPCIPAAAPRVWLDGRAGRRRRRTASALAPELGARACAAAVRTRPGSRCPAAGAGLRAGAQVPAGRSATSRSSWPTTSPMTQCLRPCMRRPRAACCARLCCSTSTSPSNPSPGLARPRKKPGRALDAGQRRRHTDR